MDETRTIGQKWLTNKNVLSLLALKKCAKAQYNQIILLKVIMSADDRQTPA